MKRLFILCAALLLSGCESQPNYRERVSMRPLPVTLQELDKECLWLRGEIARMQSLPSLASAQNKNMFTIIASGNVATLEARAAKIGCRAAFSSQGNQFTNSKSKIDQCIDACLHNTDRNSEQCFVACNK